MKKIVCFVVVLLVPAVLERLAIAGKEEKNASPPVVLRIAANKTISYNKRTGKRREELPRIPNGLEYKTHRLYFDIVLINASAESIVIPCHALDSIKLELIDSDGKKYLISESSPIVGSSEGSVDAYLLEPLGCMVHRIYMDWYKFPKAASTRKVQLRAILQFPVKIIKNVRIIKDVNKNKVVEGKDINLTNKLNLWHGEISSPSMNFLLYWNGPAPKID